MYSSFSVLMPVYRNDKPEDFRLAVESISEKQTITPNEVLIIVDGPVPEPLYHEIDEFSNRIKYFKVLRLPENKGLGTALRIGVENASNEIIARMDSDDIALPYRFEKQLKVLCNDSDLSMVGGFISEFIGEPQNVVGRRVVPTSDSEIRKYMKSRCPFNHMTVMYKKSEVLKAGNYQDWFWNEDYYLWIRMMMNGCRFANIPEPLVNVRVGKDMYARRGGIKYFKSEAAIQKFMYSHKQIVFSRYVFNLAVRYVVQVLMPNNVRAFVFQKLFRSK